MITNATELKDLELDEVVGGKYTLIVINRDGTEKEYKKTPSSLI